MRRLERLHITHFSDEHDIWVFADRVFHRDFEILDVDADLPLVDQALVRGVNEFDRVLDRQDVLAGMLWLTQSNMLAIVVLLPLPVTPARRTIP